MYYIVNVGIFGICLVTEPQRLVVRQYRQGEVVIFCLVVDRPSLHPVPIVVVGAGSLLFHKLTTVSLVGPSSATFTS